MAMKVAMVDSKFAHYSTLFKEHAILKFESMVWKQKTSKKKAICNELKGELDNLLDLTPFPTLTNEVTYHHYLVTY
jgi:hypothetical protein